MNEFKSIKRNVWYRDYDNLKAEVYKLRDVFEQKCSELGVDHNTAFEEARTAIIARIVHESNWQEGIHLGLARTRELAELVFNEEHNFAGPHLDFDAILDAHRKAVLRLRRKRISLDEIAAYNLSRAHHAIQLIGIEFSTKCMVAVLRILEDFIKALPDEDRDKVEKQLAMSDYHSKMSELKRTENFLHDQMTHDVRTLGDLMESVSEIEPTNLTRTMNVDYLHFLHRILLMGLTPPNRTGVFRKTQVHVGNPEIIFPFPSMVPALMEHYCRQFPTILPTRVKDFPVPVEKDPIMEAARVSHRFVEIHPYHDGNGRISRLLMNLILWNEFLPVYLKADKKGRHRYIWSIRRADKDNFVPLACLIALSIKQVYFDLLRRIEPGFDQQALEAIMNSEREN